MLSDSEISQVYNATKTYYGLWYNLLIWILTVLNGGLNTLRMV
jgi:hypothetical protein